MIDFAAIAPQYRTAIRVAHARIAHEGVPSDHPGLMRVEAVGADGTVLALLLDPTEPVIRTAAHRGAPGPVERALMDVLCAEIEGLPMQEASDHAAIRIEHALRDKAAPRPVPGIVTPRSADPMFRGPEALMRQAMALYRDRTGYRATANEFDAGPAPAWRALSEAERRARLDAALASACRAQGWPADAVAVQRIEFDVRVVVELGEPVAPAEPKASDSYKPALLMRLEEAVQDTVDRRLELVLAEVKDANVLRRLSEPKANVAAA
jgi:hypothetical protein